ncbi:MAG TPA: glycosyltransferase family 39 protein, partial [Terriglobales bacterium]|nr:glycosyltransferase family 39 protein [Terriglobales bacterium]
MGAERAARVVSMLVPGAQAAVALWLAWRSLDWPLIHDAPIMHYIAWRIAEGAVPYRDLFDMNFPGTYLVHLAVVTLLGAGDAAWRAVDLGVTAITAVLVAALAAPWGRAAAFGGASFFAAYHLAAGAWNAGQRDFLLCPCLLAAALGVARWAEGGGLRPVFGGGVALGAGLTIKPHAIVFLAALLAFIAVRGRVTLVPPLPAMAAL